MATYLAWINHFTPLGLRILLHQPGRLAVSIAGILLAVLLMFSQVGFQNAMYDSQAELIHRLDGELFIINKVKHILYAPVPFARRRLYEARAVPGVRAVLPLYIEGDLGLWKNPIDHTSRGVRVLACDPDDPVFDYQAVREHAEELKRHDTVLFDTLSRDYYGHPGPGMRTELARRPVTVVGTFRLGTDFVTDGNVLMSDRNLLRYFPSRGTASGELTHVDVAVVQVEKGADWRAVQQRLQSALPADVLVVSKAQLIKRETDYWSDNTAIGYIFSMGMVVGFVVGIIICYQILYTNVSNYLPQFATLKAIGYSDFRLVSIVLQQGVFLALLGFIPAVPAALVLFSVVSYLTGLLMFLNAPRIAAMLALTLLMCMISGSIAVRRVVTTDPAEVFK